MNAFVILSLVLSVATSNELVQQPPSELVETEGRGDAGQAPNDDLNQDTTEAAQEPDPPTEDTSPKSDQTNSETTQGNDPLADEHSQDEHAITEEDFQWVGEYVGRVATSDDEQTIMGLQLRCTGINRFEGRLFQGGLPGQPGFEESSKRILIGFRKEQTLVLSGAEFAIFADFDSSRVINQDGIQLGELTRVSRQSPTLGAAAPDHALIILSEESDSIVNVQRDANGYLKVGSTFEILVSDFDLHFEFLIPFQPSRLGQQRGNSGLYLQSRYECQILDSFAIDTEINGLGALYQQKPPAVNAALPPRVWQTYDVRFTAPRFRVDGEKLSNARVSAWVNGVLVQDDIEILRPTGNGKAEGSNPLPTYLQNHGDPVVFRNVWLVDRGLVQSAEFPVLAE